MPDGWAPYIQHHTKGTWVWTSRIDGYNQVLVRLSVGH